MTGALDIVSCLVFAAVLGPLGYWGLRHVHELVPGNLPEDEREHREVVLRRGAVAAQVVAVAFVAAAALLVVAT